MQQYLDLLHDVLDNGDRRSDRTGTGTIAVFGRQMRFDLGVQAPIMPDEHGQPYLYFPLLTTKRVFWKGVVAELLWLISGSTTIRPLVEQGVHIWTAWPLKRYNDKRAADGLPPISREIFETIILAGEANDHLGDLGPVYGAQWRQWRDYKGGTIDQLANVIHAIKTDPFDRGHIVTAWNPAELGKMALRPCHMTFQFDVSSDGRLSCELKQRSADLFLGVPFNIASYALLTRMVAQVCGLRPGELIWSGGNCHIYTNHIDQVHEQLDRMPRSLPTLLLNPEITDIDDFAEHDILLEHYYPQAGIKAEVSV